MFLICLLLIINTFLFFHHMLVLFIYIIVNIISVALWKGDIFLSYQTMCLESIHIFNYLFLQSPVFSTRQTCLLNRVLSPSVLDPKSQSMNQKSNRVLCTKSNRVPCKQKIMPRYVQLQSMTCNTTIDDQEIPDGQTVKNVSRSDG